MRDVTNHTQPSYWRAFWRGAGRGFVAGIRRAPYDFVRTLVRAIAWTIGILVALDFFVYAAGPWLRAHGWMP